MRNTQINPRVEPYTVNAAKMRSSKIKKAVAYHDGGGVSDQAGNIWIPDEETATGRTIRMHEPGHVDFTPRRNKAADMLDQALEDARLHRHCLGTRALAATGIDKPRRDELTVALRDLRKVIQSKQPLRAIDSLVTLRAMGICGPEYPELVSQACNRISPDFRAQAEAAIVALKASKGKHESAQWQDARKSLATYFREEFESKQSEPEQEQEQEQDKQPQPPQPEQPEQEQESESGKSEDEDEQEQEQEQDEQDKGSEGSDEDSEDEDEQEQDSEGSGDGDEQDEDEQEQGSGSDSEQGSEQEQGSEGSEQGSGDGDEDEQESGKSEEQDKQDEDGERGHNDGPMAAAVEVKKPKAAKPVDPDQYAGDLMPEFDSETYTLMQRRYPTTLYIRQLQDGLNSVRTTDGDKNRRAVVCGAQVIARKLAAGMTTPGVRIFAKNNSKGGGGSVLIDASGSMALTDEMLNGFLSTAPMLTLAFYNASGSGWNDANRFGNIYVYAANGKRAKSLELRKLRCGFVQDKPQDFKARYGSNNLIDYQALAWLLKQPGPRYFVTDCGFTGQWTVAAAQLLNKATARGLVTQVWNIPQMQAILEHRAYVPDSTQTQLIEMLKKGHDRRAGVNVNPLDGMYY